MRSKNILFIVCLVFTSLTAACSHAPKTQVQVIGVGGCKSNKVLKEFELGLFKNGFVRVQDEDLAPFILLRNSLMHRSKTVSYIKSDFDQAHETVNRYEIANCDQNPTKEFYLLVFRSGLDSDENVLGARFLDALRVTEVQTQCEIKPLGTAQTIDPKLISQELHYGRCLQLGGIRK